jgi:ABC-2 type transport system ATP-binding protein
MTGIAVALQDVTRLFGAARAVDGLTLTIPEGAVLGLLGPNGAGKTSTVRMLAGHLHPSSGSVRTLGEDPWQHVESTRRRIAYVSENMELPGWMTPEAAMRFCQRLYPRWDRALAESLREVFGLGRSQRFSELSKGQRRSLCILLALCQNADLLVLDEPAAGLDVLARRSFLDHILEVACTDGRTVVISSHILTDLERVVDRVAILSQGKLKLDGGLEELKLRARKLWVPCVVTRAELSAHFQLLKMRTVGEQTEALVLGYDDDRFRAFCQQHGCAEGAQQFGLNLEDLFVEVAGSDDNNDPKPGKE